MRDGDRRSRPLRLFRLAAVAAVAAAASAVTVAGESSTRSVNFRSIVSQSPGSLARDGSWEGAMEGDPADSSGGQGDAFRPLPPPQDAKAVVGFALASVFVSLAAGSGLGGGGILVPLYMIMLGLSPMHAVGLSNATILGSSLVNVAVNSLRKHPLVHRPMIAWDVVAVFEPASILGTVFGSMLNRIFPDWLTTVLMLAFLLWTTRRTLGKAMKLREMEDLAQGEEDGDEDEGEGEDGTLLTPTTPSPGQSESSHDPARTLSLLDYSIGQGGLAGKGEEIGFHPRLLRSQRCRAAYSRKNMPLVSIYSREASKMPWRKVMPIVLLQLVVIAMLIGKQASKCGSPAFWAITAAFLPLTVAFICFVRSRLLQQYKSKCECGYEFVDGDVHWDNRNTILYPQVCILAGVIASLFGLGGGTVKGPLMLEMGLLPEVTAATSSTMMLFTTTSAVVGYLAMDGLLVYYALLLFAISSVSTLLAQLALKAAIDKLGRPSLVVYLFATVCLLGAVGMLFSSWQDVAALFTGRAGGFKPLCPEP